LLKSKHSLNVLKKPNIMLGFFGLWFKNFNIIYLVMSIINYRRFKRGLLYKA